MGKILEFVGYIDGYGITIIGKMRAKKDDIFEEIEKYDNKIKEEVRKIVNGNIGVVWSVEKKNKIKGLYIFKEEIKDDIKILKYIKTVYTDEVSNETREKYNDVILTLAKNNVSSKEYDKIILEDKIIKVNPESKKENSMASYGGFITGFIIGYIIFQSFWGGLIYGMIFTPLSGGVDVIITNKRGRKKKD